MLYKCSEEILLNFSTKEHHEIQETPSMSSGVSKIVHLAPRNQLMTPLLPWQVATFQLFLQWDWCQNVVFMLQEQTMKWSLSVLFFVTLCRCIILVVFNVLQSYGHVGKTTNILATFQLLWKFKLMRNWFSYLKFHNYKYSSDICI